MMIWKNIIHEKYAVINNMTNNMLSTCDNKLFSANPLNNGCPLMYFYYHYVTNLKSLISNLYLQ